MHVVLKRRGITMRARWDGIAKPSSKQASHWVRFAPNKPQVNTDFVTKSSVALFSEGLYDPKQSVEAVSANLVTVNLRSPVGGTYDLSDEDLAISASMTRKGYHGSFITALLNGAAHDGTSTIATARVEERTLSLSRYHATNVVSSVIASGYKVVVQSLNHDTTLAYSSQVETSSFHYTRLRLRHTCAYSNPTSLVTSNEHSANVILLKARLPDHALLVEDDPRQYDSMPPTDESHMDINLDESNTVPDFFMVARVRPTAYYTGQQLNGGDGISHRIGNPIRRLRPTHQQLILMSIDHSDVLINESY